MNNFFTNIYSTACELLDPGTDKLRDWQVAILCLLAYLFGVFWRSFYLWTALEIPQTLLDGVPMISTEDGYYFADLVNSYLRGDHSRSSIDLLYPGGHGAIVTVTYFLVRLLPYTLEQVAVFIPMMITPLLVIPMVYTGRLLGNTILGFLAALIAVIALPYLKRTSFAYFDTDLFALTAPVLVVALALYALKYPKLINIGLTGAAFILGGWLDKSITAGVVYYVFIGAYLVTHYRHPKIAAHLVMLGAPIFAARLPVPPFMVELAWINHILWLLPLGLGLGLLQRYIPDTKRFRLGVQLVAGLALFYFVWRSGLINSIIGYVNSYGSAGRGVANQFASQGWNFYQVAGTIVEARTIELAELMTETSGQVYLFMFSLIGAVLALIRYPLLVVGGGFLAIGIFSLEGGVRFSLYMVPPLAFGAAFLALLIGRYIKEIKPLRKIPLLNYLIACVIVGLVVYPAAQLAYNYQPRTVAQLEQVEMLRNLSNRTESSDYIISWWDYGYVMSFYADMRNLINGAKHNQDNYIVSKAFASSSQRLAGNLLRESVEAFEQNNRGGVAVGPLFGSRRDDFNPHEFVNSMASENYVLSRPKTREIYLYVPYQMLPIYGVVRYFSDLNLNTGTIRRAPLITTRNYRVDQENQQILLPNSVTADIRRGVLIQQGEVIGQLNSIHSHSIDASGQSRISTTNVNSLGYYYVILSGYYGIVYVLGPEAFRSNFIQMFFFNRYDPDIFELVERNSLATLYRLKI